MSCRLLPRLVVGIFFSLERLLDTDGDACVLSVSIGCALLQEGRAYGKGRTHTFKSFREDADAFRKRWFSSRGLDPTTTTSDEVAQEYWRVVQMGGPRTEVSHIWEMLGR